MPPIFLAAGNQPTCDVRQEPGLSDLPQVLLSLDVRQEPCSSNEQGGRVHPAKRGIGQMRRLGTVADRYGLGHGRETDGWG